MADFNLLMPKMGESIEEATITKWMVKPGDMVAEDDVLLEIATDKVDTEIPSPVAGKVLKTLFPEGSLVPVGQVIAIINTEGQGVVSEETASVVEEIKTTTEKTMGKTVLAAAVGPATRTEPDFKSAGRFYSPLVRSIAQKENISPDELDSIEGTGTNNRVRKQDVLAYLETRDKRQPSAVPATSSGKPKDLTIGLQPGDEIVEMDRMRRLIADHMVMSKQTSPHVTNFIEVDVTNLVLWRDKVKDDFLRKEKQKLTFMPLFVEATAIALKEFPGINASVSGNHIILRKNIHIGFAVALKSGNLIVPVLKNADQKSLVGLAIELNRLADAARNDTLLPDDIQGGTFTISNFGTFRNLTGTPIINQPQAAILATGAIEKKPAVIETQTGDMIAIRHKMILSLSYDHRIIDGALGGAFLRKLADLFEEYDMNRVI